MLRITAMLSRFRYNCLGQKRVGPITLAEIKYAETIWIRLVQQQGLSEVPVEKRLDDNNIWRVDSRIPGYQPILLPHSPFLRRLVEYIHYQMLHGGVQSTMTKFRERFWATKLRSIVKGIIHRCNRCKQFRVRRLKPPATSDLPSFRAEFTKPFAATGVDFAGPIHVKVTHGDNKKADTSKVYIALFTCAATRAVHLELCKDLTAEEFKLAMRSFAARRGTPTLMVSDNAKTFQAPKLWLDHIKQSSDFFFLHLAPQTQHGMEIQSFSITVVGQIL
jgi:hypothetical protein